MPLWQSWAQVLACSGTSSIPSQDLDLVAVFLWRDVATGRVWVAMEGDLMASDCRRSCWWRWRVGQRRCWWWVSLLWLALLLHGSLRNLVHGYWGEARSSFWTADDPQILSMGAVIYSPTIGTTLCDGELCAFAVHIVQPHWT